MHVLRVETLVECSYFHDMLLLETNYLNCDGTSFVTDVKIY